MEPRLLRRKRREQQARSLGLAVLSATVLATSSFAAMLPATQAIGVAQQDAGAGLRSLSSAESLGVSESVAALGAMTAGLTLHVGSVLTVRNTAMRTLALEASLSGAPGLTVEVWPSLLEPGESAAVMLSGTPEKVGALHGYIVITALDGFVHRKVALTGAVEAPTVAPSVPAAPLPPLAPTTPLPAPTAPLPVPSPAPTAPLPAPLPVTPVPAPIELLPVPLPAPLPVAPVPAPDELLPAPLPTD